MDQDTASLLKFRLNLIELFPFCVVIFAVVRLAVTRNTKVWEFKSCKFLFGPCIYN